MNEKEFRVEEFYELIKNSEYVVIVSHKNPDGDAVGSSLATYQFVKQINPNVSIIIPNAIPENLKWLPDFDKILVFENVPEKGKDLLKNAPLIISVDASGLNRFTPEVAEILKQKSENCIQIDHHKDFSPFGKYSLVLDEEVSTSIIIYYIATALEEKGKIQKTLPMAYAIYTGLKTDSLSFSTSSTSSTAYYVAGKLVELGVKPDLVHFYLLQNSPLEKTRLKSFIFLERVERLNENTAFAYVLPEDYKKFNLEMTDLGTGEIATSLLESKGIVLAIVARKDEEYWKISFRSVGDFPANKIANAFGGGGHKNAAGAISDLNLETLKQKLKEILQDYKDFLNQKPYEEF